MKRNQVDKDSPKVFILFEEKNLDDYKSRGDDWNEKNIIGVYLKENDADRERLRLMKEHIITRFEEEFDTTDPELTENTENELYPLYVKNFYIKAIKGEDEKEDFEIDLKPDCDNASNVENLFEKVTQGEFCEESLIYYIESHNLIE